MQNSLGTFLFFCKEIVEKKGENGMNFDIQQELKKLPEKPGVYLMHSENDEIIYIGKAINLKNRVRQYFQTRIRSSKIEKMISLIAYFEYIVTDSELEALVLESNLIKEHCPKYNTMLTDDKSYPFIKITVNEEYPRILFARSMKRDKAKYYGPFTSASAVKDTIELLRKIYQIRVCNKSLPKDIGKDRPCIYYQIKQCQAPCQDYITQEEYQKKVEQAIDFLNGNYKPVMKELENEMKKAAERYQFEEAAEYRDILQSIQHVTAKQRITNSDAQDRDVIAIAMQESEAVVSVFFVREGKILGREHFHMSGTQHEAESSIMTAFLKQYYTGTPYIPRQLIVETEVEEKELLENWLSEKRQQRVYIQTPQKGNKYRLIELAKENAEMVLRQDIEKIKREEQRTIGAAKEIAKLLNLEKAERMEAFDISNISGTNAVASMVVFENGKPKRSDYRKFRLRSVHGPDDYKSMEEVLTRRFLHGKEEQQKLDKNEITKELAGFHRFPDVIMMDGGKGQVNVACKVLSNLNLDIPVCGMVKDDNHRTRGLYYNNKQIPFSEKNEAFDLITRMQDEAHRFAIEYHKQLRSKTQIKSVLDDIPGVGPTRRKALMKEFKDIQIIRNADIDQLMQAEGITERVAKEIYHYFH